MTEAELLSPQDFPVKTFFNAIPDYNFETVIQQMVLGIGSGFNATGCLFPDDLDPHEEKFEGIMFYLHKEEVILDYETFYFYLIKACRIYVGDSSIQKEIVYSLVEKIKEKYIAKK
ncbi:ribonuclease toxin immunity protein CdiI [Paenibacillus alba]|uniref:ribonuclease toxin immunity protein CdiI n=1 Tax=Paenibacillus alba TaxID=1197127 RepID=UPI001FE88B0A|nr:ribonuclease toxin immunity protein CdiI [Paenibacillus alba]